jgi:hypothetical protein
VEGHALDEAGDLVRLRMLACCWLWLRIGHRWLRL